MKQLINSGPFAWWWWMPSTSPQRSSRDCRIPIQTSPTPAADRVGHQHIMEWLVRHYLDDAGRASHVGVQWNVDPLDRYRGATPESLGVYLDGSFAGELDLYDSASVQAIVYTSPPLADANHTLTIESTGRKNAASSDVRVLVDAFEVQKLGNALRRDGSVGRLQRHVDARQPE